MNETKLNFASINLPAVPTGKGAPIIGLLSASIRSGKTTWLKKLIEYLPDKVPDKKILIIDIVSRQSSTELIKRSKIEQHMLSLELIGLMMRILDSVDFRTQDSIQKLITNIDNVDVLSLIGTTPAQDRSGISLPEQYLTGNGRSVMTALRYLPRMVLEIRKMYDMVLIDLPDLYYPNLIPVIAVSNFLLIPYSVADQKSINGIFSINRIFSHLRTSGRPIDVGGVLPIFSGRKPNTYIADIDKLHWIFGADRVWPLIPDEKHRKSANKFLGRSINYGYEASFDRLLGLLSHRRQPYSLNKGKLERREKLLPFIDYAKGKTYLDKEMVAKVTGTKATPQEKLVEILNNVQLLSKKQKRTVFQIKTQIAEKLIDELQKPTNSLSCEKVLVVLDTNDMESLDMLVADLVNTGTLARKNIAKALGCKEHVVRHDLKAISLVMDHSLEDCQKKLQE
jgi:cellulose biosynthesis protein BcsQ